MQGTLVIRPIRGDLARNTDFFTRMDPYVKVSLGTQHHQTSVAREQGKHPNWNDELTLQYYNQHDDDLLEFQVWDEDTHKSDDLVGTGSLAVATVMVKGNKMQTWVQLSYKGKPAGQILVDVTFTPKNGTNQQNQNIAMMMPPQDFHGMPNQMMQSSFQGGYPMMSGSQIPQYQHAQTQQFIFVHQGRYPNQNFMPQQVQGQPGFSQQTSMQPQYQSQNSFQFPQPGLIQQHSCPSYIPCQVQPGFNQQTQVQAQFQHQNSFQQQPSSNLVQHRSDPSNQGSSPQQAQVQVQSETPQQMQGQTQYQHQNSVQLQQQSISGKQDSPPKKNPVEFESGFIIRGV